MCGIIGFFSPVPADAAGLTYLGLYALQHRGQESAGIAVSDGERISIHKGTGLIAQVLGGGVLHEMPGSISIAHTRYSTAGSPDLIHSQPLSGFTQHGQVAVANNGSLVNANELRHQLEQEGSVFQTVSDSEIILNLVARQTGVSLEEAVAVAMQKMQGAYSFVLMTVDKLIAARDPAGIRPLCMGRLGEATIFASETAALDTIGATYQREVGRGEMVIVSGNEVKSEQVVKLGREAFCVFEYLYVARPDSNLNGQNVHLVRKEIGRALAREAHIEADIVIPAPESANSAAMGYAEESGIPFDFGLMKNRYVGRTFIQPSESIRKQLIRMKFNAVSALLSGKRVILVEDSIVRGTTTAQTVQMIRDAGATAVHLMIAAPPFSHPCHYGIAVPREDELIASGRTPAEVAQLIGADTLHYISLNGLYEAVGKTNNQLCAACFNGYYALGTPQKPTIRRGVGHNG